MFWLLAQQAQAAAPAAEAPQAVSGWLIFLVLAAVVIVPYVVGAILGKALKLKDISGRTGTVLFAITAAVAPILFQMYLQSRNGGEVELAKCFRLGIDLDGGTNLQYQVDHEKLRQTGTGEEGKDLNASLDRMVGAIIRRVNPSGTEEVTVRRVGQDRIEIIIPGADQAYVGEMKKRITRLGTLEFEILATSANSEHRSMIRRANALPKEEDTLFEGGLAVARWVEIDEGERISRTGEELLPAEIRTKERDGRTFEQVLVALTHPDRRVTGEFLTKAMPQQDSTRGIVVSFRFNQVGAARFYALTTTYRPLKDGNKYRLAILLDGKVKSAPALNQPISDQGVIEGNFTPKEVRELVDVLNAGALDVPLKQTPISEFTISPLLGLDVRTRGLQSIAGSCVVVVFFMVVYYKVAGIIAVFCLALNIVLIIGSMVFIHGTFTLPGLAGIALTVGMAVDANVLIFERMREESARGASTKMAINAGFAKALSAIVDSNLTTLMTALILYWIGTDQVRGFAVTLFIGLVMSLFSALFFGRLMFDVLESKRWLKKISMRQLLPTPNIDFVGRQKLCITASVLFIVFGLVVFAVRGKGNLDIDFRGGVMVTFEFREPHAQSEFRAKLEERFKDGISLERLVLVDEGTSQSDDAGKRWRLRSVETDVAAVEKRVAESLTGFNLRKVTIDIGPISTIESPKAPEAREGEKEPVAVSRFAGGSRATLKFSDEITITTASSSLVEALQKLDADKFKEPANLFALTGTSGSGTDKGETQVRKFSEMTLETRPDITPAELEAALKAVKAGMDASPLFEEVSSFAESVGQELQEQAIIAMTLSLIAIVGYLYFRFHAVTFGLAAIAALVHDVLVALVAIPLGAYLAGTPLAGIFSLTDFKINMTVIAAFMTIIGYSLNDTIVIFDRVREVRGKSPKLTAQMINDSVNQTLSRTILTALTTFFVIAVLYYFGGEGIHAFSYCMLIGVVVGTYSTVFIAAPVLLWLTDRHEAKLGSKAA